MQGEWPLTGREDEIKLILDEVRGGLRSVVLAGAAGVGKSRLAREVLATLETDGWTVHRSVATAAGGSVPLGPFAGLLPESPEGHLDRFAFIQGAIRWLTEGSAPVVLGVDDAHLLDDLSATLVHQIAVGGRASLVLSVRTGDPSSDTIRSIWKDGFAQRVELQELSVLETERLTESVLGGTVATQTLARLSGLSAGNPLFLRELMLAALDSGELRQKDDIWTWTEPVQLTPRLTDAIVFRLDGLGETENRALRVLALCEPLDVVFLEDLSSPAAIASLVQKGLVVRIPEQESLMARFAHPLYAEVLRAQIEPREAARTRRAVFDELERAGVSSETYVLRMATLHLDEGEHDRPEILCRGAAAANRSTDWVLAERLASAAHAVCTSVESALELAKSTKAQGRFEECVAVAGPYLGGAEGSDAHSQLAGVVWSTLSGALGRPDQAEALLVRAAEAAVSDQMRQRLIAYRSSILANSGRKEEALVLCGAALDDPGLDPVALAYHVSVGGMVLTSSGRVRDALQLIDRHMPAVLQVGQEGQVEVVNALSTRLIGAAFDAGIEEGIELTTPLYESARRDGDDVARMASAGALTGLFLFSGRVRKAADFGREFLALTRVHDSLGVRDWMVAFYAEALALCGDATADEVHRRARGLRRSTPRFYHSEINRTGAWVAAARGDLSHASGLALEAADEARSAGWHLFELAALYDAVRLGASGEAARLAQLAASIQGAFASAVAAYAAGLRSDDPDRLDEASRQLEGAQRILCAAEAAAQAAASYQRAGRAASARAAAARSRVLASRCEGAITPILAVGARPDPLTAREREAAQLAARGLSNKAIAERLVTSVRTVEGHLYQVYAKLGVSRRSQLSEALGLEAATRPEEDK